MKYSRTILCNIKMTTLAIKKNITSVQKYSNNGRFSTKEANMETIIACFLFEFPLVVFGRVAIATGNCFLTTALRLVSNLMIVFSSFNRRANSSLTNTRKTCSPQCVPNRFVMSLSGSMNAISNNLPSRKTVDKHQQLYGLLVCTTQSNKFRKFVKLLVNILVKLVPFFDMPTWRFDH